MIRRKARFNRHWGAAAAAAAFLALPRLLNCRRTGAPADAAPASDWFLTLRLPLLTDTGPREKMEVQRLGEWLDSLEREGFRPTLLSTARARLSRGERLPGKPVVLVIEPGYRRTFEAVLPLLIKHRWPAVWLVDARAVAASDERFVSRHELARLQRERDNEIGFIDGSTRSFTLSGAPLAWEEGAGQWALNRDAGATLARLNVNFSWTGPQLARRLQAEVPLARRRKLTAVTLYGRQWGVALDPGASPAAEAFDLDAPFGEKSASISWRGSVGYADLDLDVAAQRLVGELWVYLRYDKDRRRGLRVGYTKGEIVVEQLGEDSVKHLGSIPWTPEENAPLRSRLSLKGQRLLVSVADVPAIEFALAPEKTISGGLLELLAYDRIRGVASARSVRLYVKPS